VEVPRFPTTDSGSPMFLVELRAPHGASTDAEGMHRALQLAVSRLASTGVAIRWLGGLVVPSESRCLCFVAAGDRADVTQARDTAGLPNATVHPVFALADGRSQHEATPGPHPPARAEM